MCYLRVVAFSHLTQEQRNLSLAAAHQTRQDLASCFGPHQESLRCALPVLSQNLLADGAALEISGSYIKGQSDTSVKLALMASQIGSKSKNTAFKRNEVIFENLNQFFF